MDARTELAKAGFTTQQVLEASAGTIALAAAGGLDIANAANIAGAALNSLGWMPVRRRLLADLLAATASASAISADRPGRLAGECGNGGVVSGAVDRKCDAAGCDGQRRRKGWRRVQRYERYMRRLVPTDDALSLMSDLGVVYDASGNMNDIRSIIGQLGRSLDGLSDQSGIAHCSRSLGRMVVTGSSYPAGGGCGRLRRDGGGGDEDRSGAGGGGGLHEGFNGALEELKGALETAMIVGWQPFLALAARWSADWRGVYRLGD